MKVGHISSLIRSLEGLFLSVSHNTISTQISVTVVVLRFQCQVDVGSRISYVTVLRSFEQSKSSYT